MIPAPTTEHSEHSLPAPETHWVWSEQCPPPAQHWSRGVWRPCLHVWPAPCCRCWPGPTPRPPGWSGHGPGHHQSEHTDLCWSPTRETTLPRHSCDPPEIVTKMNSCNFSYIWSLTDLLWLFLIITTKHVFMHAIIIYWHTLSFVYVCIQNQKKRIGHYSVFPFFFLSFLPSFSLKCTISKNFSLRILTKVWTRYCRIAHIY